MTDPESPQPLQKGTDSDEESISSSSSSNSSSSENSAAVKEKKKKEKKKKEKSKKKKKKKDKSKKKSSSKSTEECSSRASPVGAGPRTPKGQRGLVSKPDELPTTPRNVDGSLWKNPLNRWSNKPDDNRITESGTQIHVTAPTKTNCWRKSPPHVNIVTDNAPFYWHKVSGDFEAMVKVSADFKTSGDKAGLMIRLDDENWILTGLELFTDRIHHSTTVTRDYSDRSMLPLPENAKTSVWICFKRMGNSFETFYSFDAMRWVQTRQGLFTERPVLQVGLSCACPEGKDYKATFDQYRVRTI